MRVVKSVPKCADVLDLKSVSAPVFKASITTEIPEAYISQGMKSCLRKQEKKQEQSFFCADYSKVTFQ